MLNPDGVILGNYRTNFGGRDLNRQFKKPSKLLYPTIYSLKNLVDFYKKINKEIWLYIDLHGHSIKKNMFSYGPEYSITDLKYYQTRIFPKILDKTTEMFRYRSCIFKVTSEKKNTARGIFLKEFNLQNIFTIEGSFGSFVTSNNAKIDFTQEKFCDFGESLGKSIYEYYMLLDGFCKAKINNMNLKKNEQNYKNYKINETNEKNEKNEDNEGKRYSVKSAMNYSENETPSESEIKKARENLISEQTSNFNRNIININNLKSIKEEKVDLKKSNKKNRIKIKKSKKKNKRIIKKIVKKEKFAEEDETNVRFHTYFGNIIEEIDSSEKKSKKNEEKGFSSEHESDKFNEGRSDSESSSDDIDFEEHKKFKAQLSKNLKLFSKILTEDPKTNKLSLPKAPISNDTKKLPKIKNKKKKPSNQSLHSINQKEFSLTDKEIPKEVITVPIKNEKNIDKIEKIPQKKNLSKDFRNDKHFDSNQIFVKENEANKPDKKPIFDNVNYINMNFNTENLNKETIDKNFITKMLKKINEFKQNDEINVNIEQELKEKLFSRKNKDKEAIKTYEIVFDDKLKNETTENFYTLKRNNIMNHIYKKYKRAKSSMGNKQPQQILLDKNNKCMIPAPFYSFRKYFIIKKNFEGGQREQKTLMLPVYKQN